ncbi:MULTISPECIES: hypothetical protein [unclassified Novosphingobium]|uniref:hypothetical protein n=1 Tax=unclassified Novosphingobium TaxID=2644732 RepID=UPI00146C51FA|nr:MULTISPECIES: hypothetical protein [unclassified Novosphingobium]NMN06765.1 hypothetical protein [Novosphingobium sp. SG919]NMN88784.1 hypothetical protein [Novosphingobium sp. SG916]
MDFPCSLPMLAGALVLCVGATPASAQTYRPDAEGYPCARHGELAIVQDDLGFSIRQKVARPVAPVTSTAIKIGNSLTLDSRLFAHTSLAQSESTHVTQR